MKITKNTLEKLIKEELAGYMAEQSAGDMGPLYQALVMKKGWIRRWGFEDIQEDPQGALEELISVVYSHWGGHVLKGYSEKDQAKIKGIQPRLDSMLDMASRINVRKKSGQRKAIKLINAMVPGLKGKSPDKTPTGLAATGLGQELGLNPDRAGFAPDYADDDL